VDRHPRSIYLLSPKQLSPETIAVAFAKTSRSPESFREIAAGLTDEKSAEFHEKWVVGYGHQSVAEHAVLHIAIENVSRLAIESIESNRLASYTEKSTRYQKWDPDGYYSPTEVIAGRHGELYRQTCEMLFNVYHESLAPVRAVVQQRSPRKEGEKDARWDGRIRSKYVDVCRFLLPAAALANLGMTANARVLEHAIRKLLSHPLREVREIGQGIKQVSQEEVPTLVKYADQVPYLAGTDAALARRANDMTLARADTRVGLYNNVEMLTLVDYTRDAEDRVLAAGLYRFASLEFQQALAWVKAASPEQRHELAAECLSRLDKWDTPLRELEHVAYTFDVLMDQGAYFEVKRHRMMTQTPQQLTCDLGYARPRLIDEAGFRERYDEAMERAGEAYQLLAAPNPDTASYLVPNAFNRRLLMTLNLREAFHFCELRSAANAHFSVRRLAARMAEMIRQTHPLLAAYMRLPQGLDWREIQTEHFSQCK